MLRKAEPYFWIAPSVILMAIFILVPIVFVFRMAFSDVSKTGRIKGFAGLGNFLTVVRNSAFPIVLKNTLVWTVAVVVISTVLGFILALILNNKFHGRKIARAIVVFPWATTLVIQASVWSFIINTDYGALNTLLLRLGIIKNAVNWTPTAGAYFAWEIACGIFVTIPFVCFTVLSGLQSIDSTYYEAATVDGAGYWAKLFKITIPLVRPSLTVSTVLNIIYVFNSFPIIWTITKGDPANRTDTLVTYLYKLAFYNSEQGQAAAVSVIGFVILLVCASAYMIYTLKKGDETA
jgi:multiple sugar transport system permease protein